MGKDIRTFDDESELLALGLHDAAFLQYSCCTQCKSVGWTNLSSGCKQLLIGLEIWDAKDCSGTESG